MGPGGGFCGPQSSSHSQPSPTPSGSTPPPRILLVPHPKPHHSLRAGFLGGHSPRLPPPGGRGRTEQSWGLCDPSLGEDASITSSCKGHTQGKVNREGERPDKQQGAGLTGDDGRWGLWVPWPPRLALTQVIILVPGDPPEMP